MKILSWSDLKTIDFLEKELRAGGVILAEGDTVMGLLADVSTRGFAQLDYIKNRSQKPYLILVPDQEVALSFVERGFYKKLQIEKIMSVCWPGPVTLILKAKEIAPQCSKSAQGNVALRVPHHFGLLKLLRKLGPLFSTSANSSGMPVASKFDDVEDRIIKSVIYAVANDKDSESQSSLPSTIIDCSKDCISINRRGSFDIDRLVGIDGDLFC